MGYTWQYYDVVLVAVFASMSLGAATGLATSVTLTNAVTAAGLLAAIIVGHALFVNGPVDEPSDLADEVDALN